MTTLPPSVETLPYFPEIYEDEILYSIVARYHRHTGNANATHTMWELFGKRAHPLTVSLPVDLDTLSARTLPERRLDAKTFAEKTTHFYYYTAYRSDADAEAGLMEMRRLRGAPQHVLGPATFSIRPPSALQFCADCQEVMLKERGEMWWRRDHQLPGVIVCPLHGTMLQRSSASCANRKRWGLHGASHLNCNKSSEFLAAHPDQRTLEMLWRFSKASAALLNPPATRIPRGLIAEAYREELMKRDISPDSWHTYVSRLAMFIRHEFGAALDLVSDALQGDALIRGLHGLLRRNDAGRHPFLHILMEQFLFGRAGPSVQTHQSKLDCRNPFCSEGPSGGAKLIYTRREGTNLVRIYECACGYSFYYTLFGDGRPTKPLLRNFGPTLDIALTNLVSEGVNLRGIMRATGLDRKPLAIAAARLSLPVNWKVPAKVGAFMGRSEPRPIRPRTRRPKRAKKRAYGPFKPWTAIDATWTSKLPIAAMSILSKVPPERVTRAELERELGQPDYLWSRKAKLPDAWRLIPSLLETTGQYQARRITYELEQFRARGEAPARWKVLRAACIRVITPEGTEAMSELY